MALSASNAKTSAHDLTPDLTVSPSLTFLSLVRALGWKPKSVDSDNSRVFALFYAVAALNCCFTPLVVALRTRHRSETAQPGDLPVTPPRCTIQEPPLSILSRKVLSSPFSLRVASHGILRSCIQAASDGKAIVACSLLAAFRGAAFAGIAMAQSYRGRIRVTRTSSPRHSWMDCPAKSVDLYSTPLSSMVIGTDIWLWFRSVVSILGREGSLVCGSVASGFFSGSLRPSNPASFA